MKVCIFGSGAIGGFLGARLARVGIEVSLIARGAQLEALRRNGLRLISDKDDFVVRPAATDSAAELGVQDAVIITLKAHSVPGCVAAMQPMLGPETMVVTAVNGIPYWYFHGHGGPFEGQVLRSVDPDATQWRGLGPERAVGCIVYPATEIIEPGVVQHLYGDKFPLGEPTGEKTPRVQAMSALFEAAGLRAPVLDRIRDEIWLKLWGNLSFNPISALTHATLGEIVADPQTRRLARAMMLEAQVIAERLGVRFRVDVERRIDGAGAVGAHKTSMLQDLERGRPMEIDALVTSVQELGRLVDVPTPTIDTVLAFVQQRARTAGLYH
jgi:2-dehydropantoate 2-reductase